jgi:hypothetical protein
MLPSVVWIRSAVPAVFPWTRVGTMIFQLAGKMSREDGNISGIFRNCKFNSQSEIGHRQQMRGVAIEEFQKPGFY